MEDLDPVTKANKNCSRALQNTDSFIGQLLTGNGINEMGLTSDNNPPHPINWRAEYIKLQKILKKLNQDKLRRRI
jgi:hypothetical protein